MTMAISKAVEHGAKAVICASTGNTSASAAAYATHAGITAAVLVPEGKIAMGKLSQAIAHDAQLLQVQGNFDDCLDIARELAAQLPGAPRQLGQQRPHRGPEDRRLRGRRGARRRARLPLRPGRQRRQLHRLPPRLLARSSSAARPRSCRACSASRPRAARRSCVGHVVKNPETIASAIRIGNPASWELALAAREDSDGYFGAIDDDEHPRGAPHPLRRGRHLRRARLARSASPACSSAPRPARSRKGATVVLTVTGHGLKDPQWALRTADGDDVTPTIVAGRHRRDRRRARPGDRRHDARTASPVGRSVHRQGARHHGEPRPRLRHARPRARALRRARRHRARRARRRRVDVHGVGAGEVPTDETQPRRARHRPRLRRLRAARCPASTSIARNTIPHGRGLGSSGAAIVSGIMAAKGLLEGIVEIDADRPARASRPRWRGTPTTSRPRSSAASPSPGSRPDGPAAQEAHRAPRRLAARARARARPCRPRSRAACSRSRCRTRTPIFNVSRSTLLIAALIQSPELLLAATEDQLHQNYRASGDARDRPAHRGCCATQGYAAVVSGAGPVDPGAVRAIPRQRLAAAELVATQARRRRGSRSCWPSTSKVLH